MSMLVVQNTFYATKGWDIANMKSTCTNLSRIWRIYPETIGRLCNSSFWPLDVSVVSLQTQVRWRRSPRGCYLIANQHSASLLPSKGHESSFSITETKKTLRSYRLHRMYILLLGWWRATGFKEPKASFA